MLLVINFLIVIAMGSVSSHSKTNDNASSIILSSNKAHIFLNNPDHLVSKKYLTPQAILNNTENSSWKKFDRSSVKNNGRNTSYWFKFDITKPSDLQSSASISPHSKDLLIHSQRNEEWLFVITWALLQHAKIHTYNHITNEWWSSRSIGVEYPLSHRYRDTRQFVFPLALKNDQPLTILLEIRSNNLLSFPGAFMTEAEFDRVNELDTFLTGGVIGSLIIMLLYNICLFIALKDNAYIYYSAFIFSIILYLLSSTGLGIMYFWDDITWFKQKAFPVFSCLAFITTVIFVRNFLNLKKYNRWLLLSNDAFLMIWFFMLAITFTFEEIWVLNLLTIFAILSSLFGVFTATYLAFKKNIEARMFIFAWSLLIVGTFIFITAMHGFIPFNTYTRYSQMLGIILELVFLSFSLAYRINHVKKTREDAQHEALVLTKRVSDERRERLKAQIETLDVHKRMNDNLEKEVEVRTQQLEAAKLKLENMNATLTELSVTDPLSGIYNRRHFDDKLIEECKRAYRINQPLAVIIADIDHFKPINDNYGHIIGDECIREVASALQTAVRRPSDLLARYGGEEFVFILPAGDLEEATQVAENCRIAVESIEFEHDSERIHLTVSAGVAAWIPSSENSYKELLKAADSALYHAKNSGRNCVQVANLILESA